MGLTFGWGGEPRLKNRIGAAKLKHWLLSADTLSSQKAFRIGLVDRISLAGRALNEAEKFLEGMLSHGLESYASLKQDSKSSRENFCDLWLTGRHKEVLDKFRWTEITFFETSPYLFLLSSVILSLWGRALNLRLILLVPALVLGFLNQIFDVFGLILLLTTPLSFFIWVNHYFAELMRKLGFVVFIFCGFILATHQLSALDNLKIFENLVFSSNSAPFNMYLNFDKVYLALVIFNLIPPLEKSIDFRQSLFVVLKYFLVLLFVFLPVCIGLGYVFWQPKANPYLVLWAINNFFFVCFFEEVVFRRFLQNQIVHYFRNTQYGDLVAIFITAVIFGVAHFSGGFVYVGLATLAGFFYGPLFLPHLQCSQLDAFAL